MIWCASTEVYTQITDVHLSIDKFEQALEENHPSIAPSMIYAYAAIKSGVPFANGAPNLTVDIPVLIELANKLNVPIAGKDFKTGQTLMKTILGQDLKQDF
jgi:myo-inositol-1-phosphate synthase